LTDQVHVFTSTATDEAGNLSSPATYTWTVDTVAPTATITGGPASLTNSKSATFDFTSNEEGGTFKCSLDGGSFLICTDPKTYNWLSEGTHTFQVEAIDAANNIGTPVSATWTVDVAKPVVTITSGPATNSKSNAATFVFTVSDAHNVTDTCQLDSMAPAACGPGSVSYSNLLDGSHTETITATDDAGNAGTATWRWTIDTVVPTATITSSPANPTNQSSATFKFNSTEPGSTFTCTLDGGSPTTCTSPKTYSGVAAGSHTFTLTAKDKAGNVSPPATFTWTVDTIAPVAVIDSGPSNPSKSQSATFTFHSEASATFKCSLDSATFATCMSGKTYWTLSEGSHTVKVEAIDLAGNTGVPVSWTWTVDLTKPTVTITSGPSDPTSQSTATFTFTASEGGVTFTCQLDSQATTTCVSGVTYTGITTARHTFKVFATDKAGNVGVKTTWAWTKQ
jgi:large repetitive protein